MTEEILNKLAQLLEQNQFELLLPKERQADKSGTTEKTTNGRDIPLVYLMNDAVESFLVFRNARMTGEYHSDYQGEITASMTRQDGSYVLVVKQGKTVLTLFFEDLELDVHLYEYAYTGHFWVKKYEYIRQLEYRLSILRDKHDYLGCRILHRRREKTCSTGGVSAIKLLLLSGSPGEIYCSQRESVGSIRRGD